MPVIDLEETLALDLEVERNFYKIKQLSDKPYTSAAFSGFAAAKKFWLKGTDEDKDILECHNFAPPKFRNKEVEDEFNAASDLIRSFIVREFHEKKKKVVKQGSAQPQAQP